MICYKDKTFCTMYLLCKDGYKCHRALTDTVRKEAADCGLYIGMFADVPSCFIPIFEDEEE